MSELRSISTRRREAAIWMEAARLMETRRYSQPIFVFPQGNEGRKKQVQQIPLVQKVLQVQQPPIQRPIPLRKTTTGFQPITPQEPERVQQLQPQEPVYVQKPNVPRRRPRIRATNPTTNPTTYSTTYQTTRPRTYTRYNWSKGIAVVEKTKYEEPLFTRRERIEQQDKEMDILIYLMKHLDIDSSMDTLVDQLANLRIEYQDKKMEQLIYLMGHLDIDSSVDTLVDQLARLKIEYQDKEMNQLTYLMGHLTIDTSIDELVDQIANMEIDLKMRKLITAMSRLNLVKYLFFSFFLSNIFF